MFIIKGVDILIFAYAVIVAAGGIMDYRKTGSVRSLLAGIICGAIIGVGAHQHNQKPPYDILILSTTAITEGLAGYRVYNTSIFIPEGLTFMSVAMFSRFLIMNHDYYYKK